MARNNYLSNPNNSFFSEEDDDVDDDTFLRNSRQAQKLKEIEERAIRSSEASIGILRDTEEIGVRTAEELMVQREQLERTEKRLDDINSTLRFSQKHITGIKSVFGSLKNYLSGRQEPQPSPGSNTNKSNPPSESGDDRRWSASASSKLTSALDAPSASSSSVHPGLRVRGLSDERDDDSILDDHFQNPLQKRYHQVNAILDRNIDEVGSSLTRLKGLAEGLGDELDSQNDLLNRINDKTDRADITIQRQNREMNRILKK